MADQVEIILRTRAELAGAIAAQKELEKTRGKLIALGESTADVDKKLSRINATLAANSGAAARAAADAKLGGWDSASGGAGAEQAFKRTAQAGGDLKKIIGEIAQQSPVMGVALRGALNPATAGFAAAIFAVRAFANAMDEISKSYEVAGEFKGFTAVVDAQAKALQDASLSAAEYDRSLQGVVDQSAKAAAMTERGIEIEKEAARRKDEERSAELALVKARIDAAEKEGKINSAEAIQQRAAAEQAYARQKLESEEAVSRAILERLKIEKLEQESLVKTLELKRAEASDQLAKLENPAVIAARRQAAEENLEAADAELKRARELQENRGFWTSLVTGGADDRRVTSARASRDQQFATLQAVASNQFDRLNEYNAARENLTQQEGLLRGARGRAASLGDRIQSLSDSTEPDLASRRRILGLNEQAAALQTSAGLQPAVQSAYAGAQDLAGQGLSTVEATARSAASAGIGRNAEAVMNLVERMTGIFNEQDAQNQQLYQLVARRLQDLERRVSTNRTLEN